MPKPSRFAGALQLVLVVAVVGGAVLLSSSLRPERTARFTPPSPDRVEVSVVEPVPAAYRPRVELNGVVQARTVTDVTPQVSGRVVSVSNSFRPGSTIARGAVLFEIERADYELAVQRTLAEIEVARSDLARLEAEAAAERDVWQGRYPDRPIPDLIARIPQIAAAKARIKSGEAARRSAELSLSRTVVRAPFDARVLETRLDVGQVVAVNASVGRVFSLQSLEVAVPVSADELRRIGSIEDRAAVIRSEMSGANLGARVARAAAAVDDRTRLGTLFIAASDDTALTVGEFVDVVIDGAVTRDAYSIPQSALTSRQQLWVVEGDRLAERRVDVLGFDGNAAVVSPFDSADGVVAIPPSDVRAGLLVDADTGRRVAGAGSVSRVSK